MIRLGLVQKSVPYGIVEEDHNGQTSLELALECLHRAAGKIVKAVVGGDHVDPTDHAALEIEVKAGKLALKLRANRLPIGVRLLHSALADALMLVSSGGEHKILALKDLRKHLKIAVGVDVDGVARANEKGIVFLRESDRLFEIFSRRVIGLARVPVEHPESLFHKRVVLLGVLFVGVGQMNVGHVQYLHGTLKPQVYLCSCYV